MHEEIETRLRALARRAGWSGAPPALVAAAVVLALVAVAAALWRWWPSGAGDGGTGLGTRSSRSRGASASAASLGAARSTTGGAAAGESTSPGSEDSGSGAATMCVHVVGAVRHPGLYVLVAGTRIGAAVECAGGASSDAATDAINLAAKVEDGEQIVVPTRKQVVQGVVPAAAAGAGAAGAAGVGAGAAKVDLNTADATQLDTLPGIGPSTAAKIVADRQTNGRFKSVDDLGRVPGIGPKKLDSLKDLVVVH